MYDLPIVINKIHVLPIYDDGRNEYMYICFKEYDGKYSYCIEQHIAGFRIRDAVWLIGLHRSRNNSYDTIEELVGDAIKWLKLALSKSLEDPICRNTCVMSRSACKEKIKAVQSSLSVVSIELKKGLLIQYAHHSIILPRWNYRMVWYCVEEVRRLMWQLMERRKRM